MTKTFKNQTEAKAAILPLYRAGKFSMWRPVTAFGRTTVSIFHGAGWLTLTVSEFEALAA